MRPSTLFCRVAAPIALAFALVAPHAQAQSAAVDLLTPPSIGGVDGSQFIVGYRFRANEDLFVSALGAYDFGLDGITGGAQVGLWTLDGGLLASASVPTGTGGSFLDGYFRYVDIADVRLSSGTEYVVGSFTTDPKGFFNANYGGVTMSVDPAISLLRNRDKPLGAGPYGLVFPDREPTNTHLGSFGPNMQIAPVPEPSTYALMALGLLGIGFARRFAHRGRKDA